MVGLDFGGKGVIHSHHMTVPIRPLIPDVHKSLNSTDNDNLIIHGDNLHALKALLPRYANKVNCIYIDPPYNTGNEGWVYNDNVNSKMMRRWLDNAKEVDGEDLERHDKWLCMMWPRLQLLKELLADDGVIFVSIDDNEQHRLRMMMGEIFGESNFVETFVWRSRLGRGATSKNTSTLHEYVIAYSKSSTVIDFKMDKRVRKKESKERLRQWGQGDAREDRPTMYYPIRSQEFGEIYPIRPDGTDGRWRVAESTMNILLEDGLVVFEKQPDGRMEAYRIFPAGMETQTAYPSMLDSEIVKTTAHGSIELRSILGSDQFAYPKPSELIKEIISLCAKKDDLVLDSFAGSGTTAHAVLALNKQDGGNRKFILVECEDYADTVTAERVRRVIKGIPESKSKLLQEGTGGSFTYYTLGDPLNVNKILVGKDLPDYSVLASHLLYTATGVSISKKLEPKNKDGLFHTLNGTDYYLLYKPDIEYLRSDKAVLDGQRVERIHKRGRKAVVFGGAKHMGQKELTPYNIEFCLISELLQR